MKTVRLAGNRHATMADARAILKKAHIEAGGPDKLRVRQGAEKAWLAVTTAADAMSGGVGSATGTVKVFERAWGAEGRAVASDAEVALHAGCFYSDSAGCTPAYVREKIARIGKLLSKPIRDAQIRSRVGR